MNATQLLEHFDRLAEAPGAVARLRRFILDLAVRGKLVAQEAGDEPVVALLKRIQKTKAQALASGTVKPEKALIQRSKIDASISISVPIPSAWAWVCLQEVCISIADGDHLPPPQTESGVPFLVIGNVRNQSVDFAGCRYVADAYYQNLANIRRPIQGDILYTLVGSYGIPVMVKDSRPFCVQRHIGILRPSSSISLEFLVHLMTSGLVFDQATNCATGIAQKTVPLSGLRAIRVPLPPLPEQHRIVAKVDELMALCDQLEAAQQERERRRDRLASASLQRLNQPAVDATPETQREHARFHLHHLPRLTTRPEHIKAMRQTIHKLAITGQITGQDKNDEPASVLLTKNLQWRAVAIKHKKIRDPRKELLVVEGNESPYLLPEQWCWARLGEVIYIRSGDGLIAANMNDGPIPVFGGNGVNGHHDAVNVNKPTLVVGRVGYYCGSVHITPEKAWITDNAFITHFCPDLFSLRFLALLLATTNLKENEGATAQPVISGSKIYPLIVGIPPLAEQHRIVAKVDELMALCDQLEAQLSTTQTDSRRLLEAVLEAALAPA